VCAAGHDAIWRLLACERGGHLGITAQTAGAAAGDTFKLRQASCNVTHAPIACPDGTISVLWPWSPALIDWLVFRNYVCRIYLPQASVVGEKQEPLLPAVAAILPAEPLTRALLHSICKIRHGISLVTQACQRKRTAQLASPGAHMQCADRQAGRQAVRRAVRRVYARQSHSQPHNACKVLAF
jgi:hypothetical protein